MVAWFGPMSAIVLALQVAGGTSLLARSSAQNWPSDVPTAELLANARRAAANLGVYHGTLSRTERIRGKITGPDVADVWVRETPHAVRMTLISGSNEGRRFLYNEALRPGEMLVRKRFVSVWIDVDSWLIKRERQVPAQVLRQPLEQRTHRGAISSGRLVDDELRLPAGALEWHHGGPRDRRRCLGAQIPPDEMEA